MFRIIGCHPRYCHVTIILSIIFYKISPSFHAKHLEECPRVCQCSPLQGDQLKLACKLADSGDLKLLAKSFPHNRTSSLTITCSESFDLIGGPHFEIIFENMNHLQHLTISDCRFGSSNSLSNETLRGLSALRSLSLDSPSQIGGSLSIGSGTFGGMVRLEQLKLSGNSIKRIPDNEFCVLHNLKWLNLSRNHLIDLPSTGVINCSSELVLLDLSHNSITSLDSGSFEKLPQLHHLHLDSNQISSIQREAFSGLNNLRVLHLGSNNISDFEEDASNLPALTVLDLSKNEMTEIPTNLQKFSSLLLLNVSSNYLETLPTSPLELLQVQKLDVSRNKLVKISPETFQNMVNLQILDLSKNRIAQIALYAFRDLPNLATLNLEFNNLVTVRQDSFFRLNGVEEFSLANNSIESLKSTFFVGLSKIKTLDLSGNKFNEVPTALNSLYYLTTLNISTNQISIPQRFLFDRFPNLETIDLSHNHFTEIPRYFLENVPQLIHLDFSWNSISRMDPQCLAKCDKLSQIQLNNNFLTSLSGFLSNLPELISANLSSNRLEKLDMSMIPKSLNILDISRNRISRVTNVLNWNSSLINFYGQFNALSELRTGVFPPTLQTANFSFNKIQQVSSNMFFLMKHLTDIDLSNNQIAKINKSSVALGSKIIPPPHFHFSSNPLKCTCENVWFRSMESAGVDLPIVVDRDQLKCRSIIYSSNNLNQSLVDIDPADFLCSYEMICQDDCVCCEFTNCDCKNECPPGCSCFRDASFAVNIVKCTGNPLIGATADYLYTIQGIPMSATHIYLDGLNLPELPRHSFLGRFRLEELYLNDSDITYIAENAFNGLINLRVLNLSHNRLVELSGLEFHNVPQLNQLELNHNFIARILPNAFDQFSKLQSLSLHRNQIAILPSSVEFLAQNSLAKITLSMNTWKCDCPSPGLDFNETFLFQSWVPEHEQLVPDSKSLYCFENLTELGSKGDPRTDNRSTSVLQLLPATSYDNTVRINIWTFLHELVPQICTENAKIKKPEVVHFPRHILLGIICGILLVMFLIGVLIMFLFCRNRHKRLRQKAYRRDGYAKTMPVIHANPRPLPRLPLTSHSSPRHSPISNDVEPDYGSPFLQYDAFVSYSSHDEQLVMRDLVGPLEQQTPYYDLCLLYRDVSTGPYTSHHVIDDHIINAMLRSQRILLVLTDNFLNYEWKLAQIRTALQCVLKEAQRGKKRTLLVVTMGDVSLQDVDPVLGHYLRTSLSLHWEEPLFWEKLRGALPERHLLDSSRASDGASEENEHYGTIVPSEFV